MRPIVASANRNNEEPIIFADFKKNTAEWLRISLVQDAEMPRDLNHVCNRRVNKTVWPEVRFQKLKNDLAVLRY